MTILSFSHQRHAQLASKYLLIKYSKQRRWLKPFVIKLIIKPCFEHHYRSFIKPIVAKAMGFELILFAKIEVAEHSCVDFVTPFIIAKEQLLDFKLKAHLELELDFVVKAYFCLEHSD